MPREAGTPGAAIALGGCSRRRSTSFVPEVVPPHIPVGRMHSRARAVFASPERDFHRPWRLNWLLFGREMIPGCAGKAKEGAACIPPHALSRQSGVRLPGEGFPPSLAVNGRTQCYMVRMEGLEPPRVTPLEPKSSASTSSATFAVSARHSSSRLGRPGSLHDREKERGLARTKPLRMVGRGGVEPPTR